MASTSKTGPGITMRVGNTLMKAPEKEFTKPQDVRPYAPVPGHKLSQYPQLSAAERARLERLPYPEQAREEELEGRVILLLEIDYKGRVVSVRVLKDPGAGLGAAAATALKRARFVPAMVDGEAVDARLHYQYDFVLEG
jgi:TonB family protein